MQTFSGSFIPLHLSVPLNGWLLEYHIEYTVRDNFYCQAFPTICYTEDFSLTNKITFVTKLMHFNI